MALIFIYSLVLYVFPTIFFAVSCEGSACKEQGSCYCVFDNGTRIDLEEMVSPGQTGKPLFAEVPYLPENGTAEEVVMFSYNPCSPFTEVNSDSVTLDDDVPCTDVAACKLTPGMRDGTPPEQHAIGIQSTATFIVQNGVFSIVYKVPYKKNNLTVELVCNKSISKAELTVDSVGLYDANMTLTHRCACPNECKAINPTPSDVPQHGLSTGSILLITFFTILIVYLVLGVTYNFCNGATGAEMLPHLGFWNDLPQLIIDGFLFTCTCFTRKQQASYSNM